MKHLKENNETYLSHFLFAGRVGATLTFRGIMFLLHAVFPFCEVPKKWNLSSTSSALRKWNRYATRRLNK